MPESRHRSVEQTVNLSPGKSAEAENHLEGPIFQQPCQVGAAGRYFVGLGLVIWWRAVNDGGDEHAFEDQAVAGMDRLRLVGQTCPEQGPVKPISAPITGEDPPRSIRAMGGRREADDQPLRLGVAEVRHGFAPILLVHESPPLVKGDSLAPFYEARALSAGDNFFVECHSAGTSTRSFGSIISTTCRPSRSTQTPQGPPSGDWPNFTIVPSIRYTGWYQW